MNSRDSGKVDWKVLVPVAALIITIFAGVLWRRPDVVFDKRAVQIPLSDSLRKTIGDALKQYEQQSHTATHLPSAGLPDNLLYVDIRNVGHLPAPKLKARIVVPGEIVDKDMTDAGPAFGTVNQILPPDANGQLVFDCENLANQDDARIRVSVWYQQTRSGNPTVEIEDIANGPAREVGSVETARFYWWEWIGHATIPIAALTSIATGLLSFLVARVRTHKDVPRFMAIYDLQQCGWIEGTFDDRPVMQIFATASLATKGEDPVEIIQAYLAGTTPKSNLMRPLVAVKESSIRDTFRFVVEPLVIKPGETYKGTIVLVDKHGNKFESPKLELPYRGAPIAENR